MFALINRQTMTLVCRFRDANDLLARHLVDPYIVLNADSVDELMGLSLLELKMLYNNLGTVPGTMQGNKGHLAAAVLRLIKLRVESSPKQGDVTDYTDDSASAGAGTGDDSAGANTSTGAEIAAPRSASRVTIFEVADQMWAAAGKPTDLPTVLALRKQMMAKLEAEHGIKRTTSSTALGGWQKARLNN